jgi:hypothetical protein
MALISAMEDSRAWHLGSFPQAAVDHDLLQAGHMMDVGVAQLLLQLGDDDGVVEDLQTLGHGGFSLRLWAGSEPNQ